MRIILVIFIFYIAIGSVSAKIDSTFSAYRKATQFFKNGQLDSAAFYFNKSSIMSLGVQDTTSFLSTRYQYVNTLIKLRQITEAEAVINATFDDFYNNIIGTSQEPYFYEIRTKAYGHQRNYFKAYEVALKNYHILSVLETPDSQLHYDVVSGLSSLTRILGFYDEGLKYANETLKLAPDSISKGHAYNSLGLIHKRLGNKDAALYNLKKSMEVHKRHNTRWDPFIMNNIAELYKAFKDYDSALVWTENGLKASTELLSKDHKLNFVLLLNKSLILSSLNQDSRAIDSFLLAHELLQDINRYKSKVHDHPKQIKTALYLKMYDFAYKLLQEAEGFMANNEALSVAADYHSQYGNYYLYTNNPDSALWHFNKTIALYSEKANKLDSTSKISTPVNQSLLYQNAHLSRLKTLQRLFENTHNVDYLKLAIESHDLLLTDILNNKYEHIGLSGASYFFKEKNKFLDILLEITVELHNIDSTTSYLGNLSQIMELKRLNTFKKEFAFREIQNISKVPDSVLLMRRNLQAQIYQLISSFENAPSVQKEELLNKQRELEEIHLFIKQKNPNFYQTIMSRNTDLNDIEKKLKSKEVLVQFSFAKEKLFVLLSRSDGSEILEVEWNEEKEEDLNMLLNALKSSNTAYDKLSAAVLNNIGWNELNLHNISRIQVIADKRLTLLPFEILKKENKYLIEEYQFIYRSSLKDFDSWGMKPSTNFIGFAPFASEQYENKLISNANKDDDTRDRVSLLPASEDEVKNILTFWKGGVYLGSDASETAFKENGHDARIIHLATHSVLDNDNPLNSTILFSHENEESEDGILHTYELLQMQLNADLVTLSACNTGVGKYYEGEGMISLATGFNIAGVSNVVVSLWPVPDNTTALIMKQFYYHLENNFDVGEALSKAKIDYLNSADANLKHPYYWAGFIATTDEWSGSTLSAFEIFLSIAFTILFFFLIAMTQNVNLKRG